MAKTGVEEVLGELVSDVQDFLKRDASAGIILMGATVLALVIANTGLYGQYNDFLAMKVTVAAGSFEIDKPFLLWINDGLMAIFFFHVGLELKRAVTEGGLSHPKDIVLPAAGAIGGMVVPVAIYLALTWGAKDAMEGWAIPAATDIAFALGIMALLGSKVPASLKIFLVTLAIIDDIGAIAIIALFYTDNISVSALIVAAVCIPILFWMNRRNVTDIPPYVLIGLVLWAAMLKSGVHATLAGVVLAAFIPMRDKKDASYSPVIRLEHSLNSSVSFVILPLFAFANAGINFAEMEADALTHPVTIGVFFGLIVGKQLGVFSFSWLSVKLGFANLPDDIDFKHIYGCALLCGVGFTMSLFIGSLAFGGTEKAFDERLGILAGSLVSGLLGYLALYFMGNPNKKSAKDVQPPVEPQ